MSLAVLRAIPVPAQGGPLRLCAAVFLTVAVFTPVALGHEALGQFVRHSALISPGNGNIDIRLDLTFHASRAADERRAMDRDHDGTISSEEASDYRKVLREGLEGRLQIKVDDTPLRTLLLHDPELDLLGDNRAGSHALALRLFFFCRAPESWNGEGLITVEDRLWLEAPALCFAEAEGGKGVQAVALRFANPLHKPGVSRVFRVHCGPGAKTPPVPQAPPVAAAPAQGNTAPSFPSNKSPGSGRKGSK